MAKIVQLRAMEKRIIIANELALSEYLTRKELVQLTGMPRTTLYANLAVMEKEGIVEKFTIPNGKKGRPRVYWKIKECAD